MAVAVDAVHANGSGDGPAAAAAIRVFQRAVETYAAGHPNATPKAVLIAAIRATADELRHWPDAPRASLTAVFHHGSRATVASVGGSAALLVRNERVSLRTPNRTRAQGTNPPNERSPLLAEAGRPRDVFDLVDDIRTEVVELEPGDRFVVGSRGLGQLGPGRGTSVLERMEELIRDHDERDPSGDIAMLLAKLAARDGLDNLGDTARDVAAVLMSFSAPAQE